MLENDSPSKHPRSPPCQVHLPRIWRLEAAADRRHRQTRGASRHPVASRLFCWSFSNKIMAKPQRVSSFFELGGDSCVRSTNCHPMTIVITKEALDSVNVHFTSLYITLQALHHCTPAPIPPWSRIEMWFDCSTNVMVKFLASFHPGFALLCIARILECLPRWALTPIHTKCRTLGWRWHCHRRSVGSQLCTARMGMVPKHTSWRKWLLGSYYPSHHCMQGHIAMNRRESTDTSLDSQTLWRQKRRVGPLKLPMAVVLVQPLPLMAQRSTTLVHKRRSLGRTAKLVGQHVDTNLHRYQSWRWSSGPGWDTAPGIFGTVECLAKMKLAPTHTSSRILELGSTVNIHCTHQRTATTHPEPTCTNPDLRWWSGAQERAQPTASVPWRECQAGSEGKNYKYIWAKMAKPGVSIAQETVFNSISSLLGHTSHNISQPAWAWILSLGSHCNKRRSKSRPAAFGKPTPAASCHPLRQGLSRI